MFCLFILLNEYLIIIPTIIDINTIEIIIDLIGNVNFTSLAISPSDVILYIQYDRPVPNIHPINNDFVP